MSEPGAQRLRELAIRVETPPPMVDIQVGVIPDYRDLDDAERELYALAPSLAVLCADMADALAGIKAEIPDVRERNRTLFGGVNVYLGADEAATVDALLARCRALTQEPT